MMLDGVAKRDDSLDGIRSIYLVAHKRIISLFTAV